MSYDFDTDNSWLDALVQEVPAKAQSAAKAKGTTKGKWVMRPEFGQKISQAQQGHKRHTAQSRQAISNYHKRPDSVLRSVDVATRRTEGIRRSRANASDKLRAIWAAARAKGIAAASLANQKPIMTPTGVFPSFKHAAEWAVANGLPNAGKKIRKWMKSHPEMFYYIPKDTK
jgi:hypothetical protein